MSRETYILEIGEVIVNGAHLHGIHSTDFRELLQSAIARELQTAALPAGRVVRTTVAVRSGRMATGGAAVAVAVGQAVAGTVSGRSSHE